MASTEVAEAVASDARAGKAIGLVGVPTVFINGKQMRLWREDGQEIVRKQGFFPVQKSWMEFNQKQGL